MDAFTDRPFGGNPATICLLVEPASEAWMRAVAAELGSPVTAFLWALPEPGIYGLRWFSRIAELEHCGHGTLASAYLLWDDGLLGKQQEALFQTRAGRLAARWTDAGIELDFPLMPVTAVAAPDGLSRVLGFLPPEAWADDGSYLVELASTQAVRELEPDLSRLRSLGKGLIVTARAGAPAFDFVSRYFAPHIGIPEDPVTGSAHCRLADYWRGRLGMEQFTARQLSRRGGTVGVRIAGDRCVLTGRAITVWRGTLLVPGR